MPVSRTHLSIRVGSLRIQRPFNDPTIIAGTLNTMSACRIFLADYDGAETYARESLAISNESHSGAYVARSLQRLATVAALRAHGARDPRHAHAARLFGFVNACLAALGSPRDTLHDRREYDRAMVVLCNAMSSDQLAKLMNEGAAMSEEQVTEKPWREPFDSTRHCYLGLRLHSRCLR